MVHMKKRIPKILQLSSEKEDIRTPKLKSFVLSQNQLFLIGFGI